MVGVNIAKVHLEWRVHESNDYMGQTRDDAAQFPPCMFQYADAT